jgi:hypothetical protein
MSGIEKIAGQANNININGSKIAPANTGGKTFSEVMANESISQSFSAKVQELEKVWNTSEKESLKMIKMIPEEFRAVFQAQIMVSKCNFQTEFATKIADAASGAVKKLSQQNN